MTSIERHREHLAGLRAACLRRPELHRHQLAAVEREIGLAAHGDLDTYLEASGGAFELTRAPVLDRLAGQARVLAAAGEPERAAAAAAEHAAALAATGHAEWVAVVSEAAAGSAEVHARRAEATAAFVRLVLCLLEARGGAPPDDRAGWEANAGIAAEQLMTADPDADLSQPAYALRIPWTGGGAEALAAWIAAAGLPGDASPEPPRPNPVAAVEERCARYVAGLGAIPDPSRQAAPGAGGPPPEVAAPLLARAADGLERCEAWPDPLLEHHWRSLRRDLEAAATTTEVELVAFHADACLAVEADWNVLLHAGLLLPFRAAAAHGDSAPAVAAAHALSGCDPATLAGLAPVARVLDRIAGDPAADPLGAFQGEGGLDLLGAARDAGIARPQDRLAGDPAPPPAPRPVALWDRELGLDGLAAVAPDRPRL